MSDPHPRPTSAVGPAGTASGPAAAEQGAFHLSVAMFAAVAHRPG
ncbi:hypothetical protein [Kitasatospora sp. NPDC094011]